eukprot:TRINITY_DN6053_c0_g1_i1.p1 TRINITY_DN6053_c0_g1~~TRINITY_DN6053_c0_g1_i1.p1  ORF type:complete len:519 (+),score=116.66 TRINITY_DN6053_c0_g1_i1:119-1675(+)
MSAYPRSVRLAGAAENGVSLDLPVGTAVEVLANTTGGWVRGVIVDPHFSSKVSVEFEYDDVVYRKHLAPDSKSVRRMDLDDGSSIMYDASRERHDDSESDLEESPASKVSYRPSQKMSQFTGQNGGIKHSWAQVHGRLDVNFEESVQRWLHSLPISKDIKDAIAEGDVARTRRLLKEVGALPAERASQGKRDGDAPLMEETKAFLHFAVLSSTTPGVLGVTAMLATEMKSFLGHRLNCRRSAGTLPPDGANGAVRASLQVPDYERPTHEGGSPLSLAVQLGHHPSVELLLSYADEVDIGLNYQDFESRHHRFPNEFLPSTPLKLALAQDDLKLLQMLEKAGAKVGGMKLALQQPELRCAKYLVENYSAKKLGLNDEDVATLVSTGNLDALRMLLRAHGGSHGKVIGPKCVLAALAGHVPVLALEEVLNAKTSATNRQQAIVQADGRNPLMIVAAEAESANEADALKKVKLLLRHGCNPCAQCKAGKTASQHAAENNLERLANFLEGAEATFRRTTTSQ